MYRPILAFLTCASALAAQDDCCAIQAALTSPAAETAPAGGASAEAAPGAAAYASPVTVTRLLKTQLDGAGHPIAYPTDGAAEVTALQVEIAPGGRTGWHLHPLPCLAYMLEGEIEVSLIDGRKHTFKAGEALVEMVNFEHEGYNQGERPARLVMFVIGTEGKAFTVKTAGPAK